MKYKAVVVPIQVKVLKDVDSSFATLGCWMVMTAVKEMGILLVEGAASDLICLEPDWYPLKPVDCSWSSAMVCAMLEEQKAEKMDHLQAQEL